MPGLGEWGGSSQFWQCQDFGTNWTPIPSLTRPSKLCETQIFRWVDLTNILPWNLVAPEKYSPLKIFTPKKNQPLKNIHPWKIFTSEKYPLLKNFSCCRNFVMDGATNKQGDSRRRIGSRKHFLFVFVCVCVSSSLLEKLSENIWFA